MEGFNDVARDIIKQNPTEAMEDEQIMELLQKDAEKGLEDLYHFDKYILGNDLMEEVPHRELCELMYKGKQKKLIMMPRGSFKSTVVTVGYTLQRIVLDPNVRILIASEKLQNAQKFLSEIKGHIERNEYFRLLYGELNRQSDNDTWNQSEIVVPRTKNMKEPTISTAGVDVVKVGMHYDEIIVDDPVSQSNVTTKDQIDKVFQWYRLLLSLLEPGGKLIIIGTRWDYGDLYGTLQEEPHASMFDIHIRQAEWYDDEGTRQLLFPERLNAEFLDEQKRIQGTYVFSCQYQNDPVPTESATFKPENFRYYMDEDLKHLELNKFMCVDPAISLEQGADSTVFIIVGIDQNNNMYILHIDKRKCLPNEIGDKFLEFAKLYNTLDNGLETVAFQKSLKYIINDKMREKSQFVKITELKSNTRISKELRIRALQPRYEQGTIFHRRNDPMTTELEYELLHFPKAKHDDISDTLASTLEILFMPTKRVQKERKKKKFLSNITKW